MPPPPHDLLIPHLSVARYLNGQIYNFEGKEIIGQFIGFQSLYDLTNLGRELIEKNSV